MIDKAEVDHIAQTVINNGGTYTECYQIAESCVRADGTRLIRIHNAAVSWVRLATDAARSNRNKFGEPGAKYPSSQTILAAAAELADYYETHVRETEALKAADAAGKEG